MQQRILQTSSSTRIKKIEKDRHSNWSFRDKDLIVVSSRNSNKEVFEADIRADILHRMVTWQLAKRRSGNRKTQERNEVTGSRAKIVRQKGSGGARHGDRKVSQYRGGGVAHGPRVRSHAHKLPRKVRNMAMRCALSSN